MGAVRFKRVTSEAELAQLHRLNHQTFAAELGQYPSQASGMLVDRFHSTNCYFAAIEAGVVVGMISLSTTAPFSIESRLPNASVLCGFARPAEIRLLAIDPRARNGVVLAGLFWQVYQGARNRGVSHLLISGITTQTSIYRALGFGELGPAVTSGAAAYLPMVLALEDPAVDLRARKFARWWSRRIASDPVLLLPGPVELASQVRQAFSRPPISHRSPAAVTAYNEVRNLLSSLAGGLNAAVLPGSGTLANDAVAAVLRQRFGDLPGIVLSNGEFGERLIRQARAAGLRFTPMQWNWGTPWDRQRVASELRHGAHWVWAVHLETSTGMLNQLPILCDQAAAAGAVVAADCVSSLGAVPIRHPNLVLASGVSGKALGALAGLAFVFASTDALRHLSPESLPVSFNIAEAIRSEEPMTTIPTPQLFALREALRLYYPHPKAANLRFLHYAQLGAAVRQQLCLRGFQPLAQEHEAAPTISTFQLPKGVATQCLQSGFQIAHESAYLRARGWGQISTMGELDYSTIEPVFEAMGQANENPTADKTTSGCSPKFAVEHCVYPRA